ncbi:hypothetical protein HGM15179_015696 [Zosterops borbonicus]|uniref:Uncharacterized protein n=1 Tax=Zosterops borbonicus TaxID=364589 RepID=A0A8K1G485_9PASS|nr:hypothetical protein HGM15179_015696 [Zosterops borbonicus]
MISLPLSRIAQLEKKAVQDSLFYSKVEFIESQNHRMVMSGWDFWKSLSPTLLLKVQDFVLGLEFYEVHMSPPLKPVKVPLDGISSFQHDCTTQLGVIHELAEAVLNTTVHVTYKDVERCPNPNTDPRGHHSSSLEH